MDITFLFVDLQTNIFNNFRFIVITHNYVYLFIVTIITGFLFLAKTILLTTK